MKKLYIIALAIILIIGGFYFTNTDNNLIKYSNSTYNISFSYPSTYIINEIDTNGNEKRHSITLTRKEDLPLPVNSEGPPTITFDIYENTVNQYTAEGWIRNSKESNLRLGEGIISTTTISNLEALSYRWSGLYLGTTIVTANPKWVYVFTVTYLEPGAEIVQDFVKIRDSIKFLK